MEYDFIGRTESFSRDTEYIMAKKHLMGDPRLALAPDRINSRIAKTGLSMEGYLAQLDEPLKGWLAEVYRLDFELFGYRKTYNLLTRTKTKQNQVLRLQEMIAKLDLESTESINDIEDWNWAER